MASSPVEAVIDNQVVIDEYIESIKEHTPEETEETNAPEVEYLEAEKIDEIEEETPTIEERMGAKKIVNLFKNFNK